MHQALFGNAKRPHCYALIAKDPYGRAACGGLFPISEDPDAHAPSLGSGQGCRQLGGSDVIHRYVNLVARFLDGAEKVTADTITGGEMNIGGRGGSRKDKRKD